MLKLVLKHFFADICISTFFDELSTSFAPQSKSWIVKGGGYSYICPFTGQQLLEYQGNFYHWDEEADRWVEDYVISDRELIDMLNEVKYAMDSYT